MLDHRRPRAPQAGEQPAHLRSRQHLDHPCLLPAAAGRTCLLQPAPVRRGGHRRGRRFQGGVRRIAASGCGERSRAGPLDRDLGGRGLRVRAPAAGRVARVAGPLLSAPTPSRGAAARRSGRGKHPRRGRGAGGAGPRPAQGCPRPAQGPSVDGEVGGQQAERASRGGRPLPRAGRGAGSSGGGGRNRPEPGRRAGDPAGSPGEAPGRRGRRPHRPRLRDVLPADGAAHGRGGGTPSAAGGGSAGIAQEGRGAVRLPGHVDPHRPQPRGQRPGRARAAGHLARSVPSRADRRVPGHR